MAAPETVGASTQRVRAIWMLTIATVGWGISFPLTKAALLAEEAAAPGRSSWFYAGLSLIFRFAVATVVVALWRPATLLRVTRLEWKQGLGLAFFGGFGILLQADGLRHTDASTSAFLTQFYCVVLPLAAAWSHRKAPRLVVVLSSLCVLAGVAILSRVDVRTMRIGRGELETLACSFFFAGQILWLERREFLQNDTSRMTVVMFGATALLLIAVTAPQARSPADFLLPFSSLPLFGILMGLAVFSTIFSYCVMNRWQPHVDATHAGLIYCIEPLFASLFALFLPGILGAWASVAYGNEKPDLTLLIGGGIVTIGNALMWLWPERETVVPQQHV